MAEPVEVIQVDREAAEHFDRALTTRLTGTQLHNLAGAFARHRLAERRVVINAAKAIVDDGVATMAAVRATTRSPEWAESAAHFHDLCGETIQRMNTAIRALADRGEIG